MEAIRYAYKGNMIMPSVVADKLSGIIEDKEARAVKQQLSCDIHFTKLEKDIIKLLVEGCTNKQIASLLHISYGTTKNYVSQIYEKLGVTDRVKAVSLLRDIYN